MQVDILKRKMEINTGFSIILLMKIKALLKKYADFWDGPKNEIEAKNGGK